MIDRQALIIEEIRFAEQVAMSYLKRRRVLNKQNCEEVISSAHLAIVQAARTFQPEKCNGNFRGWCFRRIIGQITEDHRRRTGYDRRRGQRNVPLQLDPKMVKGAYREDHGALEARDFLESLLPRLTVRQSEILAGVMEGLTHREIADRVGCTRANVSFSMIQVRKLALRVAQSRGLVP